MAVDFVSTILVVFMASHQRKNIIAPEGWGISICASNISCLVSLLTAVLPSFAVAKPVNLSQQPVPKPASLPTKPVGSVKHSLTSSLNQLVSQAPLPLHRRTVAPGAVEWCDDSFGASHPCSWVKLWATLPARDGYHGGWIWVDLDGCWW